MAESFLTPVGNSYLLFILCYADIDVVRLNLVLQELWRQMLLGGCGPIGIERKIKWRSGGYKRPEFTINETAKMN